MEISRDWGNWFAGLADGESSFLIVKRLPPHKGYRTSFVMFLRDDDMPMIFEIQERLGLGTISRLRRTGSPEVIGNSKPRIGIQVSANSECLELVRFFDEYSLRSKKARDYKVWREAVLESQKKPRLRDRNKLQYLYDKIRLIRQYDPPEIDDFEPDGIQLEFWDSGKGEADG